MELHKPKEALEAYELDLKSHPNRFNGLLGAGMAAKESGDLSKALMYFEQLLKNCDQSECKRPTIEKVKNFLTKK
jgi:cytochrome c-type biogenesis protein CcmH/NrfG